MSHCCARASVFSVASESTPSARPEAATDSAKAVASARERHAVWPYRMAAMS